jgi:peptidoglycan-associated lipoprotein
MKPIKFAKLLVLGLVLNLAAIGCHKHTQGVTDIPGLTGSGPGTGDLGNGSALSNNPTGGDNLSGVPIPDSTNFTGYARDAEIFKSDTVHFAFDSSVVKDDEKPKAAAVADYLKSHPADAVEIEGHCDERGTEEYNRSLGERRALALREVLMGLDVSGAKIPTISYGKDRPEDQGHDESAWKANRRGVFILLTPPSKVQ